MKVGEVCIRNPIFLTEEDSIKRAVQAMAEYHIGCLVVIRETPNGNLPVGIITDRDIALQVVLKGMDPSGTSIDEVMSPDLITIFEGEDVAETLRHMRIKGVRRMPVVDKEGLLCGIITVDDILAFLTDEMKDVIRLFRKEIIRE